LRIESLRLKGFIGIERGLGLNEISIDFGGIVGLVAFAGQNGAGKSTILENLHPYNQLASRDGALYRHCFLRDSEKELSFTFGGHHYRTLIKIDSDNGKSEGYIWRDGQPEVNGKISAYADYIRDLLGSSNLFFSSVFCAQNSKKISDMTTGQLKGLFAEFLRLDRLTEYENTSKQCGNVLSGSVSQLDIRIAGLQQRLSGKESLQKEKDDLQDKMTDLETRHRDLKLQSLTTMNRIDELKEIVVQNAVNLQKQQNMVDILERMQNDIDVERNKCDRDVMILKNEYSSAKEELARFKTILAGREAVMHAAVREKEISARIESFSIEIELMVQQSSDHQDAIHLMKNKLRDLQGEMTVIDNDQTRREIKDSLRETEASIHAMEQKIKDIENDFHISGLESQIEALEEKTAILSLKNPSCQSKTCAFITNALDAAEQLPAFQEELASCKVRQAENKAAAREKLDSLKESLTVLTTRETERVAWIGIQKENNSLRITEAEKCINAEKLIFDNRNNAIAALRHRLADAKADLGRQVNLAGKLPDIQVAEQRKADLEKRLQDLTEKATSIRGAFAEREIEAMRLIADQQKIIAGLDGKIDLQADERLKTALGVRQRIEEVLLPAAENDLREVRGNNARVQGELDRMDEVEGELSGLQSDRRDLVREISEWTYLRNSCSKNGLQALEIDGAAPLITGYANDLLSQAFGPLFTVRMRTQDDEGREVLDIVVILEDGSEVLLDNLSGGQKIWILMALRLAMTLLSKEKSGRNLETAFFDELDGPLDPDNSLNFISMYQAFMKAGGFKMIPFISHKPECRSMADNILLFEAGKNPAWE